MRAHLSLAHGDGSLDTRLIDPTAYGLCLSAPPWVHVFGEFVIHMFQGFMHGIFHLCVSDTRRALGLSVTFCRSPSWISIPLMDRLYRPAAPAAELVAAVQLGPAPRTELARRGVTVRRATRA